jgi:hypothetical protein
MPFLIGVPNRPPTTFQVLCRFISVCSSSWQVQDGSKARHISLTRAHGFLPTGTFGAPNPADLLYIDIWGSITFAFLGGHVNYLCTGSSTDATQRYPPQDTMSVCSAIADKLSNSPRTPRYSTVRSVSILVWYRHRTVPKCTTDC